MLTDEQFEARLPEFGLTPAGVALVQRVRAGQPVRASTGICSNVRGKFPSETMGRMMQSDSRTCETTFLYCADYDPNVEELWEQPIELWLKGPEGQKGAPGYLYRPDFLVLRNGRWYLVECKPAARLDYLCKKHPERYFAEGDGWRYPAAEKAAAQFGITFIFWTPEDHQILARNLSFLRTYFRTPLVEVPKEDEVKIITALGAQSRWRLSDLRKETDVKADYIFSLIAAQKIYVDLRAAPLAHPASVFVYISAEQGEAIAGALEKQHEPAVMAVMPIRYEPGEVVVWDGKAVSIRIATPTTVHLDVDGKTASFPRREFDALVAKGVICGGDPADKHPLAVESENRILKARPEELKEAHSRWDQIHGRAPSEASSRTLARWKKEAKESDAVYGNPLIGLMPNHTKKGNRTVRHKDFIEPAKEVIGEFYSNAIAPSGIAAHAQFEAKIRAQGSVIVPSYQWFLDQIDSCDQKQLTEARQGRRVAYSFYGFRFAEGDWIPPHGDYAWHVGHIDHTEADILVDVSPDLEPARPWITRYWLAKIRFPVAYYLSFMPPNKEAVMAVTRLCAERYGKLPDINVVDGGKDLLGTDCQKLAAKLRREFWIRPPHEGRSGSIVESGNMALNKHLLDNLPGSTKIMKQVRQVTKSVNPSNLPLIGIEDLKFVLDRYMEILISTPHPALMMSPQHMMAQDLENFGERSNAKVPQGEELRRLTMPYVPGEKCKVQKGGAIKFNYTYYSHPDLVRLQGESISVRLDPFDEAHVFAEIDRELVECRSPHTAEYLASRTYCRTIASAFLRAKKGCVTTLRNKKIARELQPLISELHKSAAHPGTSPTDRPVKQLIVPTLEAAPIPPDCVPPTSTPQDPTLAENNDTTQLEVIEI